MQRAKEAISRYNGSMPLYLYLKQFFRQHKEMGSRDRKFLQQLVFHYFRLNRALKNQETETAIALSHMLCSAGCDDFILFWTKEKKLNLMMTPDDYAANLAQANENGFDCKLEKQFPAVNQISASINRDDFLLNHLKQPLTWIRCKKEKTEEVITELNDKQIYFLFTDKSPFAIGFQQHINFETLSSFQNGWFEVQDLSSQLCGTIFQANPKEKWWDCCSGAGGKSLLLKNIQPDVQLTVSDSRESILINLKKRFEKAGVSNYKSILLNLENNISDFDFQFNGIIVDAPCTGSGTWARNPERMTFFDENEIEMYCQKQKRILQSVLPSLHEKGKLIYITCSVYAEENENVVDYLTGNYKMKVEAMQYFKGYDYGADTMFAAQLIFNHS